MKQLTHLKDNLYGIEIPADILGEIQVGKFLSKNIIRYVRAGQPSNIIFYSEELPEGNWKILGTASKDKISFDVDEIIPDGDGVYFINYLTGLRAFNNKIESFYSLLNSKGYYWENPMGEKPVCNPKCKCNEEAKFACQGDDAYWHEYEKKLLSGIILLIEKV